MISSKVSVSIFAAIVATALAIPLAARADDDGGDRENRNWRNHEWHEHENREWRGRYRPYTYNGWYAEPDYYPPPAYYLPPSHYPPPTYYAPPTYYPPRYAAPVYAPGLSFQFGVDADD
jgi:hypothetical protein